MWRMVGFSCVSSKFTDKRPHAEPRCLISVSYLPVYSAWTPTTQKLNYYVFFSESVGFDFDSWSGFFTHTHTHTQSFGVLNLWYLGQFMRTTTNSWIHWTTYKPIIHVKHCEGDRHVQRELNPDIEKGNKSLIYSSLWVWYLKVMLIFVIMILKNKFNDIHANYSIY
jgi:hypothetical protein